MLAWLSCLTAVMRPERAGAQWAAFAAAQAACLVAGAVEAGAYEESRRVPRYPRIAAVAAVIAYLTLRALS